jgi:hypothetical protein
VELNPVENQKLNPLIKYFRQPKLYIKLPSSGNFYPPGALDKTETGEYPVYAMTAKDELIMKTPDALINGQATVEVITSCFPAIKNPWIIPSIDLDAILIAIRIATYGEKLDVTVTIPVIEDSRTFVMDLRIVLGDLLNGAYDQEVRINDHITAFLRPLTYKEFTQTAIKTLEEQRIFTIVNNESIDDQKKMEMFNESFRKLTDINIGMVSSSVVKIVTSEGETSDVGFITEFIDNADKDFFKAIMDHLEIQKSKFSIKPQKIITTAEDQEAGAPKEIEVPITLDASSFFA